MLNNLPLRTFVFFWLFLAIAIPLVMLLWIATHYSQKAYEKEARQLIFNELNHIVYNINRHLIIERDLIKGLSGVPAVKTFLPVLLSIKHDNPIATRQLKSDRLAQFFASFQGIRRSLGTVRIIDARGDTLIKVRSGKVLPPVVDTLRDYPVVESGSEDISFRRALAQLNPDDVGSILLPNGFTASNALFNTIQPLQYQNQVVGYLVTEPPSLVLDRSLNSLIRPRSSKLSLAEINPDDSKRDGFILYADEPKVRLLQRKARVLVNQELAQQGFFETEGMIHQANNTITFFVHYLPYPDRLINWVFSLEIPAPALTAPYYDIRHLIWFGILLAFVIALLLSQISARQISDPMGKLIEHMIAFAKGKRLLRIIPNGPREMRLACQAFNQMADQLQETEKDRDKAMEAMIRNAKLASTGQLAAGLGHELSNPLGNIYSLTKLAQKNLPETAQNYQDIQLIREEAERASDIIKGLLSYARQGAADPMYFDIVEWLQDSLKLVERLAQQKQVQFHRIDNNCRNTQLFADRGLMQQALVNILINAIHASLDGGGIDIRLACHDDELKLDVRDYGPGIDQEAAGKLFDPFFTTKAEGQGTGLGLSIAVGILHRHGGDIQLSNSDPGCIASISIPLNSNPEDHE